MALNNTRCVDLTGALANHLNIQITLAKGSKHASLYTNHVAHLFTNKGQDDHFMVDGSLGLVLVKGSLSSGVLTVPLFFSSPTSQSIVVLDRLSSAAMLTCTFAGADEVYDHAKPIKDSRYPSQEAVGHTLSIQINIQYDNAFFYCHGGW
jgi:hypothetical protein